MAKFEVIFEKLNVCTITIDANDHDQAIEIAHEIKDPFKHSNATNRHEHSDVTVHTKPVEEEGE